MKKKVIIGLVIVLACFGISSGYIFDSDGKASAEAEPVVTLTMPQVVTGDIVARYGEGIIFQKGPSKVTGEYLAIIDDATHRRAVLWIDGLMVELVSAPLATPAPTVTPAGE